MFRMSSDLFPIKAHYFLFNGAQACYLNYLAVVGKQAGISATLIGVILGLASLVTVFMKPIAGLIADKTKNITGVIISCEFLLLIFCWSSFLSPELSTREVFNESYEVCPSTFPNKILSFKNDTECIVYCGTDSTFPIENDQTFLNCSGSCDVKCLSAKRNLMTVGLVAYFVSMLFTFSLAATLYSLSDAACYETLGAGREDLYGRQRLWGAVSWGIISPLIGQVVDATSTKDHTNFTVAVTCFTIVLAADLVLLFFMPRFQTPVQSANFFSDVKTAMKNQKVAFFTVWVLLSGIFLGVIWSYTVWFLEELHASKTLTGITFSVQALLLEVPMFFVSGQLIKRLGHFGCMTAAFICAGIKFLGYSMLVSPYYALLVEIVGGAIFPLFYASLTAFANRTAAPGTAATMQCLFGAIFEGAGVGIGNLVGGSFINSYGTNVTVKICGMAALICGLICLLTSSQEHPEKKLSELASGSQETTQVSYGSVENGKT